MSGPVLGAGDTELDKTWSLPSRSARFSGGDGRASSCFSAVGKCQSLTEELASLRIVITQSKVFQVASCSFSHSSSVLLYCEHLFSPLNFIVQSKIYLHSEVSDPEAPL